MVGGQQFDCNKMTKRVLNWVNGKDTLPLNDLWIKKFNPHTGQLQSYLADSSEKDTQQAISVADKNFSIWSEYTPVKRGQILSDITALMKDRANELAECVAIETGKSLQNAKDELNAAILQGEYFAGEGMRLYGRSLTSAMPDKNSYTVRYPRGVAGLIVPANTPIANIAWKTFPALICGNTVVLKASEDSPLIANLFAKLTKEAGLPDGVFNVVQGKGKPAGSTIVNNSRISVISFTGSTRVGRWIAEVGGRRLARVSLELGGKNPFVVCDDADLDKAVYWALLSAFSNAGQRCAAGSKILLFNNIYEEFKKSFVSKAKKLKLGISNDCDLGPVINKIQQQNIISSIDIAKSEGGKLLCGGGIPKDLELLNGYYIEPTIIEGLGHTSELGCQEVFGPVATLHPVKNLEEAVEINNLNEYGLTAAIHTRNVDRAMWFAKKVKAGVANINFGTFGSEPHMPFGGYGASGNGTREPGVESLDVYSELKNISVLTRSILI